MIHPDQIYETLKSVDDPEIGINIVDLGLVENINIAADDVDVTLIMTTPACPMHDYMCKQAERALRDALPDAREVTVQMDFETKWSSDRMTETAKQLLGWPG